MLIFFTMVKYEEVSPSDTPVHMEDNSVKGFSVTELWEKIGRVASSRLENTWHLGVWSLKRVGFGELGNFSGI